MALDELPTVEEKRSSVRAMFDRIAPRYDRLNRLLTAGLDQRWRRSAVEAVGIGPRDRVLDLGCGTGDLAELALARGARVIAADFAAAMLRGARRRGIGAELVQADAAALPFADASTSAVVCGFALRNFVSVADVLGEVARVLEPGGRLAIVEVDRPSAPLLRAAHGVYFDHVVPLLGRLLSDRAAYAYLPKSTVYLASPADLERTLTRTGFERVERRTLTLGAVQIVIAVREAGA